MLREQRGAPSRPPMHAGTSCRVPLQNVHSMLSNENALNSTTSLPHPRIKTDTFAEKPTSNWKSLVNFFHAWCCARRSFPESQLPFASVPLHRSPASSSRRTSKSTAEVLKLYNVRFFRRAPKESSNDITESRPGTSIRKCSFSTKGCTSDVYC